MEATRGDVWGKTRLSTPHELLYILTSSVETTYEDFRCHTCWLRNLMRAHKERSRHCITPTVMFSPKDEGCAFLGLLLMLNSIAKILLCLLDYFKIK